MSHRPLIGITGSAGRGRWMWLFNRLAVWRAGGRALRITPARPAPIAELDGLIVGGGDDIGLEIGNGELSVAPTVQVDPERDTMEVDALRVAEKLDLPVLGICRGAQMINVAGGGNLHGDIYETFADVRRMRTILPRKTVDVAPRSRLFTILGQARCRVNALHHQSINRTGHDLVIVARDAHGIVQAIECAGDRFVVGVQWHPEFLVFNRGQRNLYRQLVKVARTRRTQAPKPETPASAA